MAEPWVFIGHIEDMVKGKLTMHGSCSVGLILCNSVDSTRLLCPLNFPGKNTGCKTKWLEFHINYSKENMLTLKSFYIRNLKLH